MPFFKFVFSSWEKSPGARVQLLVGTNHRTVLLPETSDWQSLKLALKPVPRRRPVLMTVLCSALLKTCKSGAPIAFTN